MKGVYLVTGGGSGTGRATAGLITQNGGEVIVWGRTEKKLQEVVEAGNAISYSAIDITKEHEVLNGIEELKSKDRLTGVVHCAGVWSPGNLVDISHDRIKSHLEVIILGTISVVKGALEVFNQTNGKIVIVAAASAKPGFEDTALNTLAKRSLDGLQESLSRELRGTDVHLTTIYPDSISDADSEAVINGEAMKYDDVAEAICYALSVSSTARVEEIVMSSPLTGR